MWEVGSNSFFHTNKAKNVARRKDNKNKAVKEIDRWRSDQNIHQRKLRSREYTYSEK